MIAEAIDKAPLETGGVLMGYWADDEVVITDATGPGPRAAHHRSMFTPDADFHKDEIARLYRASGRHHTYLGDWHSHPGGGVTLSRLDERTLRTIATAAAARTPNPIMVVIAGNRKKWTPATWEARLAGKRWWPRRCTLRPRGMRVFVNL